MNSMKQERPLKKAQAADEPAMDAARECIPCLVRQAVEVIEMSSSEDAQKDLLLRQLLRDLAGADWAATPVSISRDLQRAVREATGVRDPYRLLKDRMNRLALDLVQPLREEMQRQPDPREAAVRLAIAGNLLDAGSKTRLAPDDLAAHLQAVWTRPLVGRPEELFQAAEDAHCILYLADNAGEIVFDRLLLEALPAEKITVAVRGSPVLNDATLEDAETAGLPAVAPVIANGSDAPGTMVEECSEEFRYWFRRADLIVAKGQGNFESLSCGDKKTFFLLTVKCPRIAAAVDAPVGSMVIRSRRNGDGEWA